MKRTNQRKIMYGMSLLNKKKSIIMGLVEMISEVVVDEHSQHI